MSGYSEQKESRSEKLVRLNALRGAWLTIRGQAIDSRDEQLFYHAKDVCHLIAAEMTSIARACMSGAREYVETDPLHAEEAAKTDLQVAAAVYSRNAAKRRGGAFFKKSIERNDALNARLARREVPPEWKNE